MNRARNVGARHGAVAPRCFAAAIAGLLLLLPAGIGVGARPSTCPFSVNPTASPSEGRAPVLVTFEAGVSAGVPTSYSWQFGDGGYYNATTSAAATAFHEYALPGPYTARLTVVESGCAATGSVGVSVEAAPFSAAARDAPASGTAPLTVAFNASANGGTGTYIAFRWAFGDGGVGTGPAVEYTYTHAGTFRVVLNVTDSSGNVASASVWLNVTAAGPNPGADSPPSAVEWWGITAVGVVLIVGVGLGAWDRARRRAARGPRPAHRGTEPAGPTESPPDRRPSELRSAPDPVGTAGAAPDGGRSAAASPTDGPRRTRPGSVRPSRPETLLSQRVVLHMARQGAARPDEVAPNELTQAGMVAGLGANQSSLAHVLRSLEAAGVVEVHVRHARGRRRRVKVYSLTYQGESLARELRSAANRDRTPPTR